MMSLTDLHTFAGDVIFGVTKKLLLHYIIKLGQTIYNQ